MAISFDTFTENNYNSYLTDSVHSVGLRIIRIAHLYMRRCKDHIFSEGQTPVCNIFVISQNSVYKGRIHARIRTRVPDKNYL